MGSGRLLRHKRERRSNQFKSAERVAPASALIDPSRYVSRLLGAA